jgi:hypothetical protein
MPLRAKSRAFQPIAFVVLNTIWRSPWWNSAVSTRVLRSNSDCEILGTKSGRDATDLNYFR